MEEWFTALGIGLAKLVILAFFLERALFFVFDYAKWREYLKGRGIRAPIALIVAWFVCWYYDFDVIAPLLSPEGETQIGIFLTALIAAGGSAAAIKLFQDVMGFGRQAREDLREVNEAKRKSELEKASSEERVAKAEAARAESEAAKAAAEAKAAEAAATAGPTAKRSRARRTTRSADPK